MGIGAELPSAIANGFGLNPVAGDQVAQILTFLADKDALLILGHRQLVEMGEVPVTCSIGST